MDLGAVGRGGWGGRQRSAACTRAPYQHAGRDPWLHWLGDWYVPPYTRLPIAHWWAVDQWQQYMSWVAISCRFVCNAKANLHPLGLPMGGLQTSPRRQHHPLPQCWAKRVVVHCTASCAAPLRHAPPRRRVVHARAAVGRGASPPSSVRPRAAHRERGGEEGVVLVRP